MLASRRVEDSATTGSAGIAPRRESELPARVAQRGRHRRGLVARSTVPTSGFQRLLHPGPTAPPAPMLSGTPACDLGPGVLPGVAPQRINCTHLPRTFASTYEACDCLRADWLRAGKIDRQDLVVRWPWTSCIPAVLSTRRACRWAMLGELKPKGPTEAEPSGRKRFSVRLWRELKAHTGPQGTVCGIL